MADASSLFVRDGEALRATDLARGPWDPMALHGGPVAGLCAWVAERHDPGPAGFVARLTVELLGPVPLGRLHVHASTLRPGKRVQWIDVTIADDNSRSVACARALRLARDDDAPFAVGGAATATPQPPMPRTPEESSGQPIGLVDRVGFWSANEFRMAAGDWTQPGPGAAWLRLRVPVVEGERLTPMQRACTAADFGSGVGNVLRESGIGAINPEVTVHVHRPARGEWIGLDSRAWAHAEGTGMCETVLHDEHGAFGRAVQTLLVVPVVPWVRTEQTR